LPCVVDGNDVRVLDTAGETGLAAQHGRGLVPVAGIALPHRLERHVPRKADIVTLKDLPHPARAEKVDNLVARAPRWSRLRKLPIGVHDREPQSGRAAGRRAFLSVSGSPAELVALRRGEDSPLDPEGTSIVSDSVRRGEAVRSVSQLEHRAGQGLQI